MTKVKETNEYETNVEDDKVEVKRKHEVKEGGDLTGQTLEKEEYKEEQKTA